MATVTFLFTDIAGSTRLWEEHPEAMAEALADHDELIRKIVDFHGGKVFKHTGDGAVAAFSSAPAALRAGAEIQTRTAATVHPDVGALKLRMAVHTGEAEERDSDYFGPPLNRTARLLSAAHPGQVLVSLVTERIGAGSLDEGTTLRDLGEHRLRDLTHQERIFQLDIDGLPGDFPPLRTPDRTPNNLPTLATSFVGREQEQAEVTKLIRGSRVVTITGVGGAGKTRLALQVATELAEEFPGGIWLVALGALTDPNLIDMAAAEALGVAQEGSRDIRDSVIDHLADLEALLIMDNCEHLIRGAVEFVGDVIANAPNCRVLVTSRELLGIGGEVAYGLSSMNMPHHDDATDASSLARYDAVRLFLERAEAARPDFRLSTPTAGAVIEICRRLDGMPLALELAAARLRSFTPRQIADNLDQRFRLLTGGSRTALPRQQTLAATIDWSYRLLEPEEQRFFKRLSVFQGGFSLDAVAEVCTDESLDAIEVLELLPSLVDKSLVVVDRDGEEARYRLLETLRQFARDRLDETGTADQIRGRHARFYRDLAVEAGQHIRGPDETRWWERIDTELDNLRFAMSWALEEEPDLALEIACGFWRYWWFKGRWAEGVSWLERAVGRIGPDTSKHLRAEGLLAFGSLLESSDRHNEAEQLLTESITLYTELEEEGADRSVLLDGYAAALINLSVALELQGEDIAELAGLNRRALEIARRIDDRGGVSVALGNLAEFTAQSGDLAAARELFAEALDASRALGSAQRLSDLHRQLGMLELMEGDPMQARLAFEQSQAHAEEAGLDDLVALSKAFMAICDADLGDTGAIDSFTSNVSEAFQNPDLRTFIPLRQRLLVFRSSLDAASGDLQRAGKLLGVSQVMEETGKGAVTWELRDRRDRVAELVRSTLGETEAAETMQAGGRLDETAVIELIVG